MLMADDGLHSASFEHIPDLHAFRAGQRNRLLHGDEPRTAFDSGAYHLNPQVGHCAEAENIWPKLTSELQRAALRSELGMAYGICAGLPHGYPCCWWIAMG